MSDDTKANLALEALMAFNRKERYHVVRHAVTGAPWTLSDRFREQLHEVLDEDLGVAIPDNAYVAMDYHLDWLSAAYQIGAKGGSPESLATSNNQYHNHPNGKGNPLIEGNQQDIDLLVAFVHGARLYVILVEAKADGGWANDQLGRKLPRLKQILGASRDTAGLVMPYLVFMSPTAPSVASCDSGSKGGISTKDWPRWALAANGEPYHVSFKPNRTLYRPTRTEKIGNEQYNGTEQYRKWRVERTTGFSPDDTNQDEQD